MTFADNWNWIGIGNAIFTESPRVFVYMYVSYFFITSTHRGKPSSQNPSINFKQVRVKYWLRLLIPHIVNVFENSLLPAFAANVMFRWSETRFCSSLSELRRFVFVFHLRWSLHWKENMKVFLCCHLLTSSKGHQGQHNINHINNTKTNVSTNMFLFWVFRFSYNCYGRL